MDLVKAGMEPPELVRLNHERGISFVLSDEYLLALRTAGAQEASFRHCAPPGPSRATSKCCNSWRGACPIRTECCILARSLGWRRLRLRKSTKP
jgi:hypothetical protein